MPPREIKPLRVRWYFHNGEKSYFVGMPVRHDKRLYVAIWPFVGYQQTVNGSPRVVYRFSHVRRPSEQSMLRIAKRLVRDGLMVKSRNKYVKPGVSHAGGPIHYE